MHYRSQLKIIYFNSALSVRITVFQISYMFFGRLCQLSVEPFIDDFPDLSGFDESNLKGLILAQNERWRRG